MQTRIMRPTPELLIGLAASVALHVGLMYFNGKHQPAQIQLRKGRTAVELTLLPAIAAPPPKHPAPAPEEQIAKPAPPLPADLVMTEEEAPPTPMEPTRKTELAEPIQQEAVASQEQMGSLEKKQGAQTDAQPTSPCTPVYPSASRRRGEEGTVVLSVAISKTGRTSNIKIVQSSGHKRLDRAAIKAVQSARFTPALHADKPIESTLTLPFQFQLTQ